MKKLLLVILIVLFMPSALAISLDIKEVYQPGETFVAEILGNILEPIRKENIELKRNNVQIPIEYDVKRLGNQYFLYLIIPEGENNYTLYIRDIVTTLNGKVILLDFNQTLQVSGEFISYSVKPGFAIVNSGENIEFEVFLYQDLDETITVNLPEEHEIVLEPGQNSIEIPTLSLSSGRHDIQMGFYILPVLIIGTQGPGPAPELPRLRFYPRTIESVILIDEFIDYPFRIINDGDTQITDFILDYDPEVFIIEPDPDTITVIEPAQEINFILRPKNRNILIEDRILLLSGDFNAEFLVNIRYTETESETNTPYLEEDYTETQQYYCSEISGVSCSAGDICSGQTVSSLDVPSCCVGVCETPSETSYVWVGWMLGVGIIVILIIIGLKYRKTRKKKIDPLEKRTKLFGKRVPPPNPDPNPIYSSLPKKPRRP